MRTNLRTMLSGRPKKWILTALAAVILGAFGSGLWEAILGPSIRWGRDRILDVASLGFQGYRSNVYLDIAKGVSSYASGETLNMLTLLLCLGGGFLAGSLFYDSRGLHDKHDSLRDQMNTTVKLEPAAEDAVDRELETMRQLLQPWATRSRLSAVVSFFGA